MPKKSDDGWAGKNQLPPQIPPYKAPRLARGQDKRVQDKRPVTAKVTKTKETRSKPVTVVIQETVQKDNDSEDETQFGVVWEQMTDEHRAMAEADKTRLEADKPLTIEYEGEAWKEKTYPFVFVPETEDQSIPKEKETTVTIDEMPSGETCVGKPVMKQFAEGLFKGEVKTATKKRGRYLYHVVYEDGDEEDLNDVEFIEAYELYY
jgi:hypothetical protein